MYLDLFIQTARKDIGFTSDATPKNVGEWNQHALRRADPYWISADMVELTWHASKTLPDVPLHESDLASPDGFAYFEKAIYPLDANDKHTNVRAIHWSSGVARSKDVPGRIDMGVEITLYSATLDSGDDYWNDPNDLSGRPKTWTARDAHERVGELVPLHMIFWPYGQGFDATSVIADGKLRGIRVGDWNYRAFAVTMWTLMQQRISRTIKEPLERHSRKRLERAGMKRPSEGVSIITLRREYPRLESGEAVPVHREVDWSCRWMVGGHWHKYHYADGTTRQLYVLPYIKGPEDKPLVFRKQIYAWRR
jgi:hypothetical protein